MTTTIIGGEKRLAAGLPVHEWAQDGGCGVSGNDGS